MSAAIGAVAIGRNEGQRLHRCLESLRKQAQLIVYVDSGSTDGSVEYAKNIGALVVELDRDQPFTAARARNAGWRALLLQAPNTEFIQFVDGDCELVETWLPAAMKRLLDAPLIAVVCGRRRERFPEASLFNRLMDFEWDAPIGEVAACGGDSLVRVSALQQVAGFNDSVLAGEEPEFCHRLRQAGWRIERLAVEMTLHDAAIANFHQWCRRQMRSGYGALDVTKRFGITDFCSELRSARLWTLGWIGITVLGMLLGGLWSGWVGAGMAAVMGALLWLAQAARIALRGSRRGLEPSDAVKYGLVTLASKFASFYGQLRWWIEQQQGRSYRPAEYKAPGTLANHSTRP